MTPADFGSLARADALTTHPSAVLELEPRTFVEVEGARGPDWLPDEEIRRLRLHFLRRARESRKTYPALSPPLLRIASQYGAYERARRTA